jgi:hypothetical protein
MQQAKCIKKSTNVRRFGEKVTEWDRVMDLRIIVEME